MLDFHHQILAFYGEPQWATVGDTFPVGCAPQNSIVYRDWSFKDNPDVKHKVYGTKNGIYEENCGLDKVLMSWGHDEYLYQVLKHNKCTLPLEAMYMIRYVYHRHYFFQLLYFLFFADSTHSILGILVATMRTS